MSYLPNGDFEESCFAPRLPPPFSLAPKPHGRSCRCGVYLTVTTPYV